MTAPVVFAIVGPVQHGVVSVATEIAQAASDQSGSQIVRVQDVRDLVASSVPAHATVHLHFTDRLFGPNCEAAAIEFAAVAAQLTENRHPVSVTLHDVPIASADDGRYRRRAQAYADVVAATTGAVIVCSRHEANLTRRFAPDAEPVVIELPIKAPVSCEPNRTLHPEVAILGFLYPGKGHAEAIGAMGLLPSQVRLTALGRPADDHDDLVEDLTQLAIAHRRTFTVSGWIPEDRLRSRLRQVAVPLAAHREVSASASIGSWLSAGRRPLVADGAFTRELDARCPGSVTRYHPGGLGDALAQAFADPQSTWLATDVRLTPSPADTARGYLDALSRC